MLTRRAFAGAVAGLFAGHPAGAVPLPAAIAGMPGLIVVTPDGVVLYLTETGQVRRRVPVRVPPRDPWGCGWVWGSVSPDGTRLALFDWRDLSDPLTAGVIVPLSDAGTPVAIRTPIQSGFVWDRRGRWAVGSTTHVAGAFGELSYRRNVLVDTRTGAWDDLPLPAGLMTGRAADGSAATTDAVVDWSPDGRWFLTLDGVMWNHKRRVALAARDLSGAWPLTPEGEDYRSAAFAPDGRRVLLTRRRPGRVRGLTGVRGVEVVVEVLTLLTRQVEELGRWDFPTDGYGHEPDLRAVWDPDGRRVAVLVQRYTYPEAYDGRAPRPTGEFFTCDPDGRNRRVVRAWVGPAPYRLLGWA